MSQLKKELKILIAEGDLETVIKRLLEKTQEEPVYDKVIQLSGRLKNIKDKKIKGTSSSNEIDILENKLREALLLLVNDLPDELSNDTTTLDHPKLPHALTENPFSPPVFIGRDKEMKQLYETLFSGENFLLMVNGKGGMGKTSLASRYYHKYQNEYAHVAWVLSEKSITKAMLTLAMTLGLDFSKSNLPLEERLNILLQKLANLEKPCLLVIDNVNEPADLKQHFLALRQCSNFHILLTSRITKFPEARFFKVNGLSVKFGIELFQKHYSNYDGNENGFLEDIIKMVERNTLIIELMAKNLAVINLEEKAYSLYELYDDIKNNLVQLSKMDKVNTLYQAKGKSLREESPEAIVLAMYDVSSLSEDERQMISIFAVLPNEEISFQVLKKLLPKFDFKIAARKLVQKGWIDFDEKEKTYKVNQVVQDVVRVKHAERLEGDCDDLMSFLKNEMDKEDFIHRDNYTWAVDVVRFAVSIFDAFDENNFQLARLCYSIGNFYNNTGDLVQAMDIYQKMLKTYQSLSKRTPEESNYKNGIAISYNFIGDIFSSLGKIEEALKNYELYCKTSKELFKEDPTNTKFKNDLAISYSKLGETPSSLGNLEKALTYFEEDLKLTKELYENYPKDVRFKNGLAISYSKLGETQSSLGNLEKALTYFEEVTELFEELYKSYPKDVRFKNGLAISYSKLGKTQSSLGNLEKALMYFEDYSKLEKELNESYPNNVSFKNSLAISYSKLGDFYQEKKKDFSKAKSYFEKCYNLWEELSNDFPAYKKFQDNFQLIKEVMEELN
ncbi:MAG: tetratricopeptide repeat protein [Saprospiraceae bacterium]